MSKEESVEAPLMRTCHVLVMTNTFGKETTDPSVEFYNCFKC